MDLRETNPEDLRVFDAEKFRAEKNHVSYEKQQANKWKNRDFSSSLDFALSGLLTTYREERNFRKHLLVAGLVILAGLFLQIGLSDWLFLLSSIFLVMTAEIINSAIENLVDLVCGDTFSPLAKNAKDMAAGAVLLLSIYASLVGLLVFGSRLLSLLF